MPRGIVAARQRDSCEAIMQNFKPPSMRGTDLMYKVKYQTIENILSVKPNVK